MPELPEVETTRLGIHPHICHQRITKVTIRQHQLRWKIPKKLAKELQGRTLKDVKRRGKYLLFTFEEGTLILHLGMSGCLRILRQIVPAQKHDHLDIEFTNKIVLRYTDPRRFGAVLWTSEPVDQHPLLAKLGLEPLTLGFSGKYLWNAAQGRKTAIKSFIMNNKMVVGVGNIYATEALFLAKIHPNKPAQLISIKKMHDLVKFIKQILKLAIRQGGTTLKDFFNSEGKPGYFVNKLQVYGREGLPCMKCHRPLLKMQVGQRTTVYCQYCQS